MKPQNSHEINANRSLFYHQIKTRHHKSLADGNESMTMFGDIDNDRFLPAEQEVADHRAEHDSEAEPPVVGHEDQHEHEGERHLHQVEKTLIEMHHREHRRSKSEKTQKNSLKICQISVKISIGFRFRANLLGG